MSHPLRTKTAIAAFAGLSLMGALAGCSATSATGTSADSSSAGANSGATTTSSGATYKDGTYTAPGTYVSPGGTEHISVELTLKSNIVTAVTVKTVQADPTAAGYEQMFEGGISGAVVGKNIDTLNVGVVAGSSLTSQGFDDALNKIKSEAKS
jgi:uncharacterized protein with FMN-binding domain